MTRPWPQVGGVPGHVPGPVLPRPVHPSREEGSASGFATAVAVSVVVWSVLANAEGIGRQGALLGAALLAFITIIAAITGRAQRTFVLLAYAAAVQPAIRLLAPMLPYFTFAYVAVLCGALLLLRRRGRWGTSLPTLAYGAYFVLELAGLLQAESLEFGRTIVVPSATVLMFLLLSDSYRRDVTQFRAVVKGYLVGTLSLAALMMNAVGSGAVQWSTQSSSQAAAGMGPNQISLLLGCASFMALILGRWERGASALVYYLSSAMLAAFTVLTFSRGGLYMLVGAIMLATFVFRRITPRTLMGLSAMLIVGFIVFQTTVSVTDGRVIDRFTELSTTNRTTLVQHGWQMFAEDPVSGVGTGNYYLVSERYYSGVATGAHNELIRAAAEHGALGLLLWLLFGIGAVREAFRRSKGNGRQVQVVLVLLMLVSTSYNGLKLLVQPLLLFLALAPHVMPRPPIPFVRRVPASAFFRGDADGRWGRR